MKKTSLVLLAALLTFSNFGYSKMIDSNYEVATWSGFTKGAITYTFDDGYAKQFNLVVPMFDEFGFKLTLYIITGNASDDWEVLQAIAKNGHEVASHTISHPSLSSISKEKQETELKVSKEAIDANIPECKCLTMAYPNCRPGDMSIVEKYYIAARNCQGRIEKSTPDNFMNISSIVSGSLGLKTAEQLSKKFEDTAAENGWCVLLFHGIDDEGGYSPVSFPELKKSVEYINEHKDTLWVETFVNVVRYIKERDAVSIKETSNQDDTITLQVTDTLDNEIYNYPITIRRALPDGWDTATVKQNDKKVKVAIVDVESKPYIMFEVIPDAGDIVITKSKTLRLM